jgi:uncharacterized membrane protein
MTIKPLPPLYFILVHYSYQWVGGEPGLRLISLLFGLLTIPLINWVGKLMGLGMAGRVASWLWVATPGVLYHFVDANPYTILVFWNLLSVGFLLKGLKNAGHWRYWILHTLSVLGGMASHTLFIFYAASGWLALVLAIWLQEKDQGMVPRERPRSWLWQHRKAILFISLQWVLWILWSIYFIQNKHYPTAFHPQHLISPSIPFALAGLGIGPLSLGLTWEAPIFLFLLCLGAVRLWRFQRRTLLMVMVLWIPAVCGIGLFIKLTLYFLAYRYGLGIYPLACLLAATAIVSLPASEQSWRKQGWRVLLLLVFLAGGLLSTTMGERALFLYQDWRECARQMTQTTGPGDILWFPEPHSSYSFRFYYRGPSSFVTSSSRDLEQNVADMLRIREKLSPGARLWILKPQFSNRRIWIDRFAKVNRGLAAGWMDRFAAALRGRGSNLRLVRSDSFLRIDLAYLESL